MKIKSLSFIFAILFCSCSSYYQIQEVTTGPNLTAAGNTLVYEDPDCVITYDLWSNGGNTDFVFENKTGFLMYLNLDNSFFIKNGMAYDYNPHQKANKRSRECQSEANPENAVIKIPSHSKKVIRGFQITQSVYENCDLNKKPKEGTEPAMTFNAKESPVTFENRINYETTGLGEKMVTNTFYVSKVTNLNGNDAKTPVSIPECSNVSPKEKLCFVSKSPASYYLLINQKRRGYRKETKYTHTVGANFYYGDSFIIGADYNAGYQFNPYLNAGVMASLGYDVTDTGLNIRLIPNAKFNFTNNKISPFVRAGAGLGTFLNYGKGFYFAYLAEFGTDFKMDRNNALSVGLGLQNMGELDEVYYETNGDRVSWSGDMVYSRFTPSLFLRYSF